MEGLNKNQKSVVSLETHVSSNGVNSSLGSCEGGCIEDSGGIIRTFQSLIRELKSLYEDKGYNQDSITTMLKSTNLDLTEINRYSLYSSQESLPYTRNLVYSNDDFTLLVLCWRPGFESKIHNHPVRGCFVLPLLGSICETRYELHSDNTLKLMESVEICAGEKRKISFMSDSLGMLHKISNTSKTAGAVTLHLYTPPFSKCNVWSSLDDQQPLERTMVVFSTNGIRPCEEDSVFDLEYFI